MAVIGKFCVTVAVELGLINPKKKASPVLIGKIKRIVLAFLKSFRKFHEGL